MKGNRTDFHYFLLSDNPMLILHIYQSLSMAHIGLGSPLWGILGPKGGDMYAKVCSTRLREKGVMVTKIRD